MSGEYSFTVVIPSYNSPRLLESCVQSLTQLDYNKSLLEVIIVDDGSSEKYRKEI